jgi:tetratricopeptide (TPR) repeat protein
MNEPKELESTATAYASGAVEFEKQGEISKAISSYQKAIECLNQLIESYPDYGFHKIYNDKANLYQDRINTLQVTSTNSEYNKPLPENQESTEKVTLKSKSRIDLESTLLEINKKLDFITASIAELKDEAATLKLNVKDALGKSEQAQKEVAEIKNLVYSIKYDR